MQVTGGNKGVELTQVKGNTKFGLWEVLWREDTGGLKLTLTGGYKGHGYEK